MKKNFISVFTLSVLCLLFYTHGRAQQYFTNVFDFQKINTKSFTSNFGTTNEQKHINSSVFTCLALADLAQNGDSNEIRIIGEVAGANIVKVRAQKLSYTPFQVQWGSQSFDLRMVFVRPNDQVVRPCVILSPGSGGDFHNWYNYLTLGVADYVSKGYAVAFFENWNNKYVMAASEAAPDASTNLVMTADAELPFYALYQFANAAAKYVVGNSGSLKINPNLLFAGGNSAGGFSAYSLALTNSDNFTDPIFSALGGKNDKTKPEFSNMVYTIKGLGMLGSGLLLPTAKMGDLIDPSDSNLRAVLWHGGNDPLIFPTCCPNTPCNNNNGLTICGAISVGERLCAVGAMAKVHINCPGGHLVVASQMTNGQINSNPPNAATILGPLKREVQQMMTIQLKITEEFKKIIAGTPASSCTSLNWKPKNYPNPLGTNWYLVNSTACVSGTQQNMPEEAPVWEESQTIASVSPNPSSGIFSLSMPDFKQNPFVFSVCNMLGQQVLKGTVQGGSMVESIDLSHLPDGVYQLNVQQGGRFVLQEKLLLQK